MEDISSPDTDEGFNEKDLSVSHGLDVLLSVSLCLCACLCDRKRQRDLMPFPSVPGSSQAEFHSAVVQSTLLLWRKMIHLKPSEGLLPKRLIFSSVLQTSTVRF